MNGETNKNKNMNVDICKKLYTQNVADEIN